MQASDDNATVSPADQALLEEGRQDLRRHLAMKGLPPTGSIYQGPSASEIKRRIARLREGQRQHNKQVASR